MKNSIIPNLLLILILGFISCTQKDEISEERFTILADTLAQELEYDSWMDFAYELAKNYPDKYESAVILTQASERSIMENDEEQFLRFFDILQDYPESGALEISDQIAIGNQIAWITGSQGMLQKQSQKVMDYTIKTFKEHENDLQWQDEIGSAIYNTQAMIHAADGLTDEALQAYSTSISYFEQPEALIQRALLLEERGDLTAALEDYIAALGYTPGQSMLVNKVKEVFQSLNPDQNADQFIIDIRESLNERRKEEVLSGILSLEAPDYNFTDFAGKTLTNSNQSGKIVFVDFWATWCGPCRRELPEFQKFYDQHKNNPRISFVAASTDQEREKVKPHVADMGFTFPIAFDEGNAPKFGVEGIPSLFIIGPEGKIRYKIVGFDPDKDFVAEMNWRLESLLDS
jgi:thiol-disulfide isomerase/thioredoxin